MDKYFLITKTLSEYGVTSYQELWKKAQDEGCTALQASIATTFTKAEEGDAEKEAYTFIFSSEKEDRHGDIVRQNFDVKHFKKNPVFLDSHNYWTIQAIIGKVVKIGVVNGNLQGDVEFATGTELGALAAKLVKGGFLNAVSIGFIPKEFSDKGEILKSELLEVSAVSVPAQAEAVLEREKSIEEPETPPEPEIAPTAVPKASTRVLALKAVEKLKEEHETRLKRIATAIAGIDMASPSRFKEKRKVVSSVRKLISTDN